MNSIHVLNCIVHLIECQIGCSGSRNFAKIQSQEQIYLMFCVQKAHHLPTRY